MSDKIPSPKAPSPVSILKKLEGRIHAIKDGKLKGRLVSLGINKGKHIHILRASLFGGAYYVKVDHQVFGMRKEELEQILVV